MSGSAETAGPAARKAPAETWSDARTAVAQVKRSLAEFNAARDWEQFHTGKDLAMQISVEAAELLELFLWKSPGADVDAARVREELADVFLTVVNLAARLDIDLMEAAAAKLARNGERYPVALARGRADKYDQLDRATPSGEPPRED